jgi:hypothetical protein
MMSDNAWNTGHNPTDGQNPWHFSADGTFKTLKDGHHGTWGIEMRERLYLILIWKSQPKHEWADFVFSENKDKHVKLDWVRGGWSWMKGYQIVNKGWNANVVVNHCTVVKQAHECTADKMCLFEKNACRLMSHEEKIQSDWFTTLKGIGYPSSAKEMPIDKLLRYLETKNPFRKDLDAAGVKAGNLNNDNMFSKDEYYHYGMYVMQKLTQPMRCVPKFKRHFETPETKRPELWKACGSMVDIEPCATNNNGCEWSKESSHLEFDWTQIANRGGINPKNPKDSIDRQRYIDVAHVYFKIPREKMESLFDEVDSNNDKRVNK